MNDDYVENSRIETLLKKVGFDVMVLGTEVGLADKIISFNPDIVVAAGSSSKVASLSVGMKLKDLRSFNASVILGFPKNSKINPMDLLKIRMDRLVEAPFADEGLVRNMCEILALNSEAFLQKLRKAQWSEATPENQVVSGALPSRPGTSVPDPEAGTLPNRVKSRMTAEERKARQQKALASLDIDPHETMLSRASVRDKWADLKKDWDFKKIEDQNELKKDFAGALFQNAPAKKLKE
jgi:hypothetical protein